VSITTKQQFAQPALIGGAVVGVLSALPIISVANLCCCLWVITGGAVAAYVLQQNQQGPITPGDGALAGLFAGLTGAVIYLLLSIPITLLMAPVERVMMERVIESGRLPPEFQAYVGTYTGGAVRLVAGFFFMVVVGAIFSTIGGLIGAAVFKKTVPPGTPAVIDIPAEP
jgi:hypothetical protein